MPYRTLLSVVAALTATAAGGQSATLYLSTEDLTHTLSAQRFTLDDTAKGEIVIPVDRSTRYQSVLGIGSSLEHATCYNLTQLSELDRDRAIASLVDPEDGIGMNLMRICIGTSDFTNDPWYSYDDMPEGETDVPLARFSIDRDRDYVLPVLQKARAANPELLFFASPWSAPGWMKSRGKMTGGKLLPEFYEPYARYLLKFVEAYEGEGIPIYALTLQNEPDYCPNTYPTTCWRGTEQATFIRDFAGPLLATARPELKIWCWDHNFNLLDFPRAVLRDPSASAYVDGTGFHHYEGEPDDMSVLREEFPDKDIYFTEGSTFGTRGAQEIIAIFRNWARSYSAWVTVIDENGKPNNGPHDCSPTCIVFHSDTKTLEYRFDYYMYGQFSKFIQRDAVRVATPEGTKTLGQVAFENPDGRIVVVLANSALEEVTVGIELSGKFLNVSLPPKSVATAVW